ncbi:hypothetical protein EGR_10911 [Echinococcus granulosus]|uniref:Uncharacterized protein n=1 Tax=Echinococcus granulosus TaxID=6210 RepID=W6U171_ECHGR|nr:hypothetical protein EGR_10911 [Echinococcus granulosus]EUB54231.1 hypothetical protein EGR_10911 [Echinococcus granulosus]
MDKLLRRDYCAQDTEPESVGLHNLSSDVTIALRIQSPNPSVSIIS